MMHSDDTLDNIRRAETLLMGAMAMLSGLLGEKVAEAALLRVVRETRSQRLRSERNGSTRTGDTTIVNRFSNTGTRIH